MYNIKLLNILTSHRLKGEITALKCVNSLISCLASKTTTSSYPQALLSSRPLHIDCPCTCLPPGERSPWTDPQSTRQFLLPTAILLASPGVTLPICTVEFPSQPTTIISKFWWHLYRVLNYFFTIITTLLGTFFFVCLLCRIINYLTVKR